jgi:hypothetical protein
MIKGKQKEIKKHETTHNRQTQAISQTETDA